MAWSFAQGIQDIAGGTGVTLVMPINLTSGNKLIVGCLHSYLGCSPTIADTQSNTFTKDVNGVRPNTNSVPYLHLWETQIGSSTGDTITLSYGCGNATLSFAFEYSGLVTGTAYDVDNNNQNNTTSLTSGSVTTTAANDLVLSIFKSHISITINGGSGTSRYATGVPGILIQDQNQATAGAVNPSATGTTVNATYPTDGWTVAFKQAGGVVVAIPNRTKIIQQAVNRASTY